MLGLLESLGLLGLFVLVIGVVRDIWILRVSMIMIISSSKSQIFRLSRLKSPPNATHLASE
jgi:hypothetical protein